MSWTPFNYSVCGASVSPAHLPSRKGKYCRSSSRGLKCVTYPQIVLAGEQKPAENSTFDCGVTVKRLYTATPSVIDEHLFGVFYHCLFDIINLSGWSIFQWCCTLGHFSSFCLIPLHRSYLACADFNLLECFSSLLYWWIQHIWAYLPVARATRSLTGRSINHEKMRWQVRRPLLSSENRQIRPGKLWTAVSCFGFQR